MDRLWIVEIDLNKGRHDVVGIFDSYQKAVQEMKNDYKAETCKHLVKFYKIGPCVPGKLIRSQTEDECPGYERWIPTKKGKFIIEGALDREVFGNRN